MRQMLRSFWPGVIWFVMSSIAFFLPGAALPEEDWFDKIKLDKIVHIGLFAAMVFLWCRPLFYKPSLISRLSRLLIQVPFIFFGYSILVEFIQLFFIQGRSFDVFDILADGIGCFVGFLLVKRYQRFWFNTK